MRETTDDILRLPDEASRARVTPKAVAFGLVGAAAANFLPCWSAYVVHSSRLCFAHLPIAALLPCVFVVLPANFALRLVWPQRALTSGELCVAFCMTWVAGVLPAAGYIGIFLACLGGPYYFATPENKWDVTFLEYLPQWAFPSNEGHAMAWFYEGAPVGAEWPWGAWIGPLVWWGALLVALGGVCVSCVVIFRKQWLESERLTYPLAEVPLALSETQPGGGLRILRSKMFWIGASIPLFIISWNIIGFFVPGMPEIAIGGRQYIRFGRYVPRLNCRVNFFMIGLAYFARVDVLFSVWFFYLLAIVQQGVFNRIGFTIGPSATWSPCGSAATLWQSYGAFASLTAMGLWVARRHLAAVVRAAVGRGPDESGHEMLTYRQALWTLVLSLVFMFAWFCRTGMPPVLAAVYLVMLLATLVGVTKIVVETGIIYAWPTVWPQNALMFSLGTANLAPASIVTLSMGEMISSAGFSCTFVMIPLAHVVRLIPSRGKGEARPLRSAMAAAIVAGALVCVGIILYWGYDRGAYNFGVWTFRRGALSMFGRLSAKIRNPQPVSIARLVFFGIGVLVYATLQVLRFRFHWWPLAPVGLAMSSSSLIDALAFSVFVAWVAKRAILRIGGERAHRSAKPLFLGLSIGYITGIGLGFLADWIFFFGQGHMLHVW